MKLPHFLAKTIFIIFGLISTLFLTSQKSYASDNLLANPDASAGLTGWTFVNGGSGWTANPSFYSSYAWGTMSQSIDLLAKDFSATDLDSAPTVTASMRVSNNFNASDWYSFKVQLKNNSGNVISEYYTGEATVSGGWNTISHTFSGYGTGLRYIYFELRGKDSEFWGGQYGSIFDDASLTLSIDPSVFHTLSYLAGSHGSLSGDASQSIVDGEDGSAITAIPDEGYHFSDWSDDSTDNPRIDTDVTGDISVTANFAINTYTVTFEDYDESVLKTETVNHGASATAPSDPERTGYTFTGWDAEYDNVTSNLTITAEYEINTFTLSYSVGDNGTLTGTTSQTVNYESNGTEVVAVPNSNYAFIKWSDDSVENPRTDLNVTENLSVTATFEIIDPDAPIKTAFKINNGEIYTNSKTVTLTIGAEDELNDVTEMMVCDTPNFTNCDWESYAVTKSWELEGDDEIKSAYIKFRDSVGNESLIYSDSIILDTSTELVLSAESQNDDNNSSEFTLITEDRRETNKPRPKFAGTGEPGATVTITIHSDPIVGVTTVDDNGDWEWWPEENIPEGEHDITIEIEDEAGNTAVTNFQLGVILGETDEIIDTDENTELAQTGNTILITVIPIISIILLFVSQSLVKRRIN